MIPIETIKELALDSNGEISMGGALYKFTRDEVNAFANAIEAMTIDRCAEFIDIEAPLLSESIRALKNKE